MRMYYEIHGTGDPLVLLHGTFSAIGTSFGRLLPHLAKTRKVIAVEFQGHGRTADIDRPFSSQLLADDVAALLDHFGIGTADLFGYSLGSSVAFHVALKRPDLVRKLVLASFSFSADGMHPGLSDGFESLRPEHLIGSPFHDEYLQLAPRPADFPALVEKVNDFMRNLRNPTAEDVQSITAPTMVVIGDSDIIRPEHAVETFRLLGGGVAGDQVGLPKSRLAVLPGTTHVTLVHRADWLSSMIDEFLDAS
ncbi:alpha/beta hydrolase [Nonomuraea sp. K274]|uniref:Alpha/beta hydrolase n=2 Tax=Nonomuraea cypriaca TaxID=1187855 RepID=A0A931A399_9ACTN|nr:alpha/beta hydrolase [Nonomuraea cypriaca]